MTDKEKIVVYENVLDEVAYGAPWGGPLIDHVKFMRNIAHKALVETGSSDASGY